MKRNKALLFCCAVLLAAGMLAGCASAADKPLAGKHFKLAMNATFAPFESVSIKSDGKSEIVGFDVDLLNAMAADLGFTYEIKDMEFKGLIGELHSGRADFVISGLSPTEERKKTVDFSIDYFFVKTAIIEKKGAGLKTVADLKGKKVAAVFGTEYNNLAKASGAEVTALDSSPLVMQELMNGRVQAAIMDASQAALKCKENPTLEFFVIPKKDLLSGVSGSFAMAFQKGSPLVPVFDREIEKLRADGTMKKLMVKWIGEEFLGDEK